MCSCQPAIFRRHISVAVLAMLMLALTWDRVLLADDPLFGTVEPSAASELWRDWPASALAAAPNPPVWTIDYRFRSMVRSRTSYEFGTPEPPPSGWAPLSQLNFPLDSYWHGLQVGVEKPTWAIHFEWLFPQQGIQGNLSDYDWLNPGAPFTDLGYAQQRWTEGQMLDLAFEFQLADRPFGLPVEVWPVGGFRWQRFDIMCYDLAQVKSDDVWLDPPYTFAGDVLTLNQQYYMGYVGGQLRSKLELGWLPPIALKFQGDWGGTGAYNVDHHLLREGDRYTMECTQGGAVHLGLTVEALVHRHLSLGVQADYLEIRTHGTHRLLNVPEDVDETWDNGVSVSSDQTWLTAFVKLRI